MEYKVLVALEADELIYVDGLPLVNGAFGIEKPAKLGPKFVGEEGKAVPKGRPHAKHGNLTAQEVRTPPFGVHG